MNYLNCIELLNLALQQLKSGQRAQVPVSKLPAIQKLMAVCKDAAADDPFVVRKCEDVIVACSICLEDKTVAHLTQVVRDSLINGIQECVASIAKEAWNYYSIVDVPLSDKNIPLLRIICEYHYLGG